MSARARRREIKNMEETPRTNRSVDLDRNRRSLDFQIIAGSADHYYRSADYSHASSHVTRGDEGRGDRGDEGLDCTDGFETGEIIVESRYKEQPRLVGGNRHRQPSVGSTSSSSDNEDDESTPEQPHAHKKEEKEINNFISLLSTTLLMNPVGVVNDDDDDDEDEAPVSKASALFRNGATYVKRPSLGPQIVIDEVDTLEMEPAVHSPSADPQFAYPEASGNMTIPVGRTMTTTGRLWERITVLRKDCIRGLGVEKLKRAYDILDNVSQDSVEVQLVALLGRSDYDEYTGKIWQLKFCEEAAFGLV